MKTLRKIFASQWYLFRITNIIKAVIPDLILCDTGISKVEYEGLLRLYDDK